MTSSRTIFDLTSLAPLAEVHHLIFHHLKRISPSTLLPLNSTFYNLVLPSVYQSVTLNSHNAEQFFHGFNTRFPNTRKNRALALVESLKFEDLSSLQIFHTHCKVTPSRHTPIFPSIRHVHFGWEAVVPLVEVVRRRRVPVALNSFAKTLSYILGYHMSTISVETIMVDYGRLVQPDSEFDNGPTHAQVQSAIVDLTRAIRGQGLTLLAKSEVGEFDIDPILDLYRSPNFRVIFAFDTRLDTGKYENDLRKAALSILRTARRQVGPEQGHKVLFVSNRVDDIELELEKMYENGEMTEGEMIRLRRDYEIGAIGKEAICLCVT
nr:uncharacterized protein CI109_003848 [Kwoniella shandongensis]KAA5527876.1 hypothetical protein CI109_003848 [Kwoniella shandongensis]